MFILSCKGCRHENKIKSSRTHRAGRRGVKAFDLNTKLAIEMIDTGNEETHVKSLRLPKAAMKRRERDAGRTKADCEEVMRERVSDQVAQIKKIGKGGYIRR